MAEEGLTKTDNDLIHIGKPIPFDTDEFLRQMEKLAVVAYGNDPDMHPLITRHLIEMIQNQTINQKNVIKKNYEKSKMAYFIDFFVVPWYHYFKQKQLILWNFLSGVCVIWEVI